MTKFLRKTSLHQYLQLLKLYIFIEIKTLTMLPSQKIKLFSLEKQPRSSNPQQAATFQLLQISDEDYSFDPLYAVTNAQQSPPKLQKHRSSFSQKNNKNLRNHQAKPSISGYLGKTHNNQKQSARYISGEEVCVMKKEKVVNLSNHLSIQGNFLVIDQYAPQVFTTIAKQEIDEEGKANSKPKPPKNIVAFIRRRNLSYLKQQFSSQLEEKQFSKLQRKSPTRIFSPLRKIYASCQLKKADQEPTQTKQIMQIFERPVNGSPQMSCTSPNFRNRKMSNYIKYRIGMNKPEKNLY